MINSWVNPVKYVINLCFLFHSTFNFGYKRDMIKFPDNSKRGIIMIFFGAIQYLAWKNALTCPYKRVTRGERCGVSPTYFQTSGKKCRNLGENALMAVIYGLNFPFKVQFLRVSWRKNRIFFLCETILFRAVNDCLSKYPNSKKTPLP